MLKIGRKADKLRFQAQGNIPLLQVVPGSCHT